MTTPPLPTQRAAPRVIIRAAIVTAVLTALLAVEFTSRSGVGWRLITFTYQANLLAATYYAWTLVSPGADRRTGLRGAVVLYVVVAGVIWNLLLTGRSMGYTPANFLLHVVVPVLAVADWLFIRRGVGTAKWWPFAWLAYPAAYAGVALVVLNHAGRRAPYYFLDPGSVGAVAVALNVGMMGVGFLGLGYLLLAVARPTSANAQRPLADLACRNGQTSEGGHLRIAMRYVLSVAGIATFLLTGSAPVGLAATPGPTPVANIAPGPGQVVGVAMPVTVTFAGPVANRAAAERSIAFDATSVPQGNFTWLDDDVLQWSPSGYWPAHSTVSLSVGNIKTDFQTGSTVVGVADLDAHTFTVSIDGQVARTMPASMGKPNHTTPIGSFTALEKQNPVVMDSRTIGIPLSDPEGYKLTVYDAVRVTWGGVYVHAAPWSVASQGNANVSHGCINLSPDNAAWYYDTVNIGDPIIVQA